MSIFEVRQTQDNHLAQSGDLALTAERSIRRERPPGMQEQQGTIWPWHRLPRSRWSAPGLRAAIG